MKIQIAELTILDIRILTSSQNPYGQNQYQQGPYNQQQPYNPQYQQQPPQYQQQPYAQQPVQYNAYGNPVAYNPSSSGNLPNRGDDDDEDEEEDDDRDRDRDTCGDDDDCKEICDDIFKGRDSKKCGRLSKNKVKDLKDVFVAFQDVDLDDVETEDLATFIKISLEPLTKEARRYKGRDSEDVLAYIADDDDITELFAREDTDFRYLETLLREVDDNLVKALSKGGNDSFMAIAIYDENEEALDWVREYFEEGTNNPYNRDCDDEGTNKEACVFDKYCRMAEKLSVDSRKDFLDISSEFEDLLEDVVTTAAHRKEDYKDNCGATDPGKDAAAGDKTTVNGARFYSCTGLTLATECYN